MNLFTQALNGFITRFANPVGLDTLGWRYYIVFLVFYIIEIIFVYFYFPETKGRTLVSLLSPLLGICTSCD